jgi:FKBP-type peptidyl-prolyl cis-trans isomerase
MKSRSSQVWVWLGLAAVWGCDNPRITPVMPPGVNAPKLAPPTSGSGAQALGETASAGGAPEPSLSKLISEPTPVGHEKKTASGMTYMTQKEGTGPTVKPGQTAILKYSGKLENGTKFYDTADHGGTVDVVVGAGRNIQGLDEGVPGMKVGEQRRLVIPGSMGYGAEGQKGVIAPNATLIVEVELVGIK